MFYQTLNMDALFQAVEQNDLELFRASYKNYTGHVDQLNAYKPIEYLRNKEYDDILEPKVREEFSKNREKMYNDAFIRGDIPSTLLGCAANYGRFAFVKYLVEKGADVNLYDMSGYTPLLHCVMHDHLGKEHEERAQIVEYLMENGADIFARDKSEQKIHQSPYDIALRYTNELKRNPILHIVDPTSVSYDNIPVHVTPIIINQAKNNIEEMLSKAESLTYTDYNRTKNKCYM